MFCQVTADNVQCSHGAVVSDIDHEAAFYLLTRGVSNRDARWLLLKSFILEALKGHPFVSTSALSVMHMLYIF